jgi:hypothetical protein
MLWMATHFRGGEDGDNVTIEPSVVARAWYPPAPNNWFQALGAARPHDLGQLAFDLQGQMMKRMSFRFNGVRVAIGAFLLSVSGGLGALLPGLAFAAGMLFVLGVAVSLSGLFTFRRSPVTVHEQWDTARVVSSLREAPRDATVRILQTWFPEESFIDSLRELLLHDDKRFELHLLLLDGDPTYEDKIDLLEARMKLRNLNREKAEQEILTAIARLVDLKTEIDETWRRTAPPGRRVSLLDLEIRLYDFLPFGPIYQIGAEVMYGGFFINYDTSSAGPMLEVRNTPGNRIWQKFEKDFAVGWNGARQYFPPATAQASPNQAVT